MEPGLAIADDLTIPLSEISVRTSRSSGPGGQHANTSATRVEVEFDVAASRVLDDHRRALILRRLGPHPRAVAQDTRSQARNRELALERLRARLAAALHRRRPRRPTRPTAASRTRRLEAKRRASERKRARRRPSGEE
jgi:ribosome-associated protein